MKKIRQKFYDLKITRKIQIGFFIIAVISTIIAVDDYFQFKNFEKTINKVFDEFIAPSSTINILINDLNKIEKATLKLANPQFADKAQNEISKIEQLRASIEKEFSDIEKRFKGTTYETTIKEIKEKWHSYSENVIDGIISAVNMQMYEMAGEIATTIAEAESEGLFSQMEQLNTQLRLSAAQLKDNSEKLVSSAITLLLAGMLFGTIVFLFAFFVLGPSITKPLIRLKEIIGEYAIGKFDRSINVNQKDEIGELANAMRKLREAQEEKIKAATDISKGVLTRVKPASEHDELAKAFNQQVDTIETIIFEINEVSAKNTEEGDLSVRTHSEKLSGEWKNIAEAINKMLDIVIEPIEEASSVLSKMGEGDFTHRVSGNYKGFYKLLKDDVNLVAESMNKALGEVFEAIENIANASNEILEKTSEMAAGANEQNEQSTEVASAIEEMTKTIMNNSQNVMMIEKQSVAASKKAKEGGEVVNQTVYGIDRISEIVIGTASTMRELGASSEKINEVVKVINEIADQTNLLALNAAIEAARAGEQGRGFAVVADEVRKLAERTQHATKEIAEMISEIQVKTQMAMTSINSSAEEVEKDKDLAQNAKTALEEIILNANEISDLISQLAAALEQESKTSEEISRSITAISSVAENTAANTGHITNSAEIMYELTNRLQHMISKFNIDSHLVSEGNEFGLLN